MFLGEGVPKSWRILKIAITFRCSFHASGSADRPG
jgi:hypothetical protein